MDVKGELFINMFSIISIVMLISGLLLPSYVLILASGLFAIAGSLGTIAYEYRKSKNS